MTFNMQKRAILITQNFKKNLPTLALARPLLKNPGYASDGEYNTYIDCLNFEYFAFTVFLLILAK